MTSAAGPQRGPTDPLLRQQWRARRREAALEHHPDRGGDAGRLHEELARIDAAYSPSTLHLTYAAPGRLQPVSRALRRTAKVVRRRSRGVRARIPPRWPGSRRYLDL